MPKYTGDKFGFGKSPDGGGGGASGPGSNTASYSKTFSIEGTWNWTVPAGVTKVSVLCIGSGGGGGGGGDGRCGGGGGAICWGNDIAVTPGESIEIKVGDGGRPPRYRSDPLGKGMSSFGESGDVTYFKNSNFLRAGGGTGGGNGFSGSNDNMGGGNGGTFGGTAVTAGYNGGQGGTNYLSSNGDANNGGGGGAPGNYLAAGDKGEDNIAEGGGEYSAGGGGGVGNQGTGGTGKYMPRWTTTAELAKGGAQYGRGDFSNGGSGAFSAPWGMYAGSCDGSTQNGMDHGGGGGFPGGGGGGGEESDKPSGRGAGGTVRIIWGGRTFPENAHDMDDPDNLTLGGEYYSASVGNTYSDCDWLQDINENRSLAMLGGQSNHNYTGVARVVLNGYGILFYGWIHNQVGTSMHEIELPSFLLNKNIDITFIGSGGGHNGGGGGGGGGAGGGRWYGELNDLTAYISTGTNLLKENSFNNPGSGTGQFEEKNTRMTFQGEGGWLNLYGPHAGESQGSIAEGGNVYNYKGPAQGTAGQLENSNSTRLTYIQSVDPTFEYCYGGCGQYLHGFGNNSSWYSGSDLGGGGGGQCATQYGGSCSPGAGGRFGYAGGYETEHGFGPMGGLCLNQGSHTKGPGGSFGGGCGDAGNNDTAVTQGGGAILIRWDTTLATAQSTSAGETGFPGKRS